MKALFLLLAATSMTVSMPAAAQHAGHGGHAGHSMPAKPAAKKAPAKKAPAKKAPAKKAASKKAAPKKAATKKSAPKKAAAKKAVTKKTAAQPAPAADPHAGHAQPAEAAPAADPHAGHAQPAEPAAGSVADPHAGHSMPDQAADPHAGHDMGSTATLPPLGPPPPEAFSGPQNAADSYWGTPTMERSRAVLLREHGGMSAYKLLVDRAETGIRKGRDGFMIDAEGWFGGDIDKLWVKTEVEGEFGEKLESAEVQTLWSHAIDPWFDLQAGLRYDFRPDQRARLVLGVQGLAPYWIEIDAAAFLSDKGDMTARFEAEHDMRITQKLILQPQVELDFSMQDIEREGIGAGLSTIEAGARLRYEISPQFAPYIGIGYDQAIGRTRRFRRLEGEDGGGLRLMAGLRAWF